MRPSAWGSDSEGEDNQPAAAAGPRAPPHAPHPLRPPASNAPPAAGRQPWRPGPGPGPPTGLPTQPRPASLSHPSSHPSCHPSCHPSSLAPAGGSDAPWVQAFRLAARRPLWLPAVPSLQALCLGCIGCHLPDFLSALGEDVGYLPPDARHCLLAVARRRGLLTKRVLRSLLDDSWVLLDVAGTRHLSCEGLAACLAALPRLRALDVAGLTLSTTFLLDLAQACPQLQLLRVGGNAAANDALVGQLKRVLPRVKDAQQQQGEDVDWEQLAEDTGSTPALPAASGRLQQLQYIVWPDMPPAAQRIIAAQCPRLCVNPAHPPLSSPRPISIGPLPHALVNHYLATVNPGALNPGALNPAAGPIPSHHLQPGHTPLAYPIDPRPARGQGHPPAGSDGRPSLLSGREKGSAPPAPLATDPSIPLDEPLAQCVGHAAWQEVQEGGGGGDSQNMREYLSLAEKFKKACEQAAARQERWEHRELRRQERRSSSGAAGWQERWLDDV